MAGYSDHHHLDRFDHHHDEGIVVTSSPHDKIHLDGDELLSPHHIITLKCIGILVMIGLTTLFCMLPYKTYSCEHRQRLISFANCFGGGVLFGTIFLHLIPEVSYQMTSYLSITEKELPFPLAESLEVLGFLLILFLETVCEQVSVRKLKKGVFADDCEKCEEQHNNLHMLKNISSEQCSSQPSPDNVEQDVDKYTLINSGTVPVRCVVEKRHNIKILLLSLVTHSIFEGVAVGVETQAQTILGLLGSILIHKCAIALTLGPRLVTQDIKFKLGCVYAVILAIGTPLGIVIGVAVEVKLTGSTLLLVTAVIQALATGIFLYITFAEILFVELKKKSDMRYKIPLICLGVLIIGLASLIHTHSHVLEHHEDHHEH